MAKVRLWIVTELFYPEQTSTAYILTEIARALSVKYEVHVICGNPVYDESTVSGAIGAVIVHRLTGRKVNKDNKVQRIVRAVTLTNRLCSYIDSHKNEVDKVVAVTNPIFLVLKLSQWCKKNSKYFCLLTHDIFPENAINTHIIKSKFLGNLLRNKFDKAYSNCNQIIVCGTDMKNIVEKKVNNSVEVRTITNWADCEKIYPLEIDSGKRLIIQFAGNLGRVQGLIEFLSNIIKEVDNNELEFVFRGSGAVKNKIKQIIKAQHLSNVKLHEKYSRSEENYILNQCDLALVTLHSAMYGLGVPSKAYNIMAAGKPVLFIGPEKSEIYNEVINNDIGFAFTFDNKDKIIDFLQNLSVSDKQMLRQKGRIARQRAVTAYSKEKILIQYLNNI